MTHEVKLPDKLSELVKLAVKEARSLDRDNYFPRSDHWYIDHGDGNPCEVCFAGAVIAGMVKGGKKTIGWRSLNEFGADAERKLIALENVRLGNFEDALNGFIGEGDGREFPGMQCAMEIDILRREEQMKRTDRPGYLPGVFHGWGEFDSFLDEMDIAGAKLESHGY